MRVGVGRWLKATLQQVLTFSILVEEMSPSTNASLIFWPVWKCALELTRATYC
jgi:hypothetical protein